MCHANRMKPFVDPSLRPIDPPPFDDPAEAYINESDIPKDCFEPISAEANSKDTDLKTVSVEVPLSPQPQKEKEVNKELDQEKTKNQLQNAKESTAEAIVIDNETVFSAEKILKHRKRNGKVKYLVKWLTFPKNHQRGNRNTIFWIDVSLIIIFNHKNNSSFCSLPYCLAYISLIFSYP